MSGRAETIDGCRRGVLAFGDSITNGGGELQWGVALQSWALWTARGLGLPYLPYAVDGATAADVVRMQLAAFRATAAFPDGRWELGCLYVGTNDVRRAEFSAEQFAGQLDEGLAFLAERCDRVLTATIPLRMGRPPAGAAVQEANRAIEACASRAGALVVDLRDFGGRNLVMADRVHPTAFGQIAIAERALDVLGADGMTIRARPSQMIVWSESRWGRLKGDWTYAYRAGKETLRGLSATAWARVAAATR